VQQNPGQSINGFGTIGKRRREGNVSQKEGRSAYIQQERVKCTGRAAGQNDAQFEMCKGEIESRMSPLDAGTDALVCFCSSLKQAMQISTSPVCFLHVICYFSHATSSHCARNSERELRCYFDKLRLLEFVQLLHCEALVQSSVNLKQNYPFLHPTSAGVSFFFCHA
jgi:hypothetical protein